MSQSLTSLVSSTKETRKLMKHDEKAYDIIQDHISDALLIKTRSHKTVRHCLMLSLRFIEQQVFELHFMPSSNSLPLPGMEFHPSPTTSPPSKHWRLDLLEWSSALTKESLCYTWSWVRGKCSLWVKGSRYKEGLHLTESRGSYARNFLGKDWGFEDTS